MPFQTQVNGSMAMGVPGDFASLNPRAMLLAGPGAIAAGALGVTIGGFAWLSSSQLDADNAPAIANSFGAGPVSGFVARPGNVVAITTYLGDSSMVINPGFSVNLHSAGDFFVINSGATEAQVGMYAYATLANGKVTFAAANAPSTATASASSIAAATASASGSIAGDLLTITGAVTGTFVPGCAISGTGVATGTTILSQVSGTTGGDGVYAVSIPEQTVTATTISATYGVLTAGGTITGTIGVGDTVAGTGVTAGTVVVGLGTGAGGAGTYNVNLTQTATSNAYTFGTSVQTKWIAMSAGAAGETIKISSYPLG